MRLGLVEFVLVSKRILAVSRGAETPNTSFLLTFGEQQ